MPLFLSGFIPRASERSSVWKVAHLETLNGWISIKAWVKLGHRGPYLSAFKFFLLLSFDHSIWTSSIPGISIFSTFLDVCMVDNFF